MKTHHFILIFFCETKSLSMLLELNHPDMEINVYK